MIVTRKIGSLVRGKATPFQIYSACILGCLLGFLPGFSQAPGLVLAWSFLLLILNANLFLAGIVTLLGKLVFLLTMPVLFLIGRVLLEGPIQGVFKLFINAPVTAYMGLDYYVVAGGQLVAIILGIVAGSLLTRSLNSYRRKMKDLSENSEKLKTYSNKSWIKVLTFLFLGGGKGKKSYDELLAKRIGNPIRAWGLGIVVVLVALLAIGANWLSGPMLTRLAKSNLETANGATVDLASLNLDLKSSKIELQGLEMADPEKLDTNVFASKRIVADVDSTDLLRKRFSINQLVVENASSGLGRESPGRQIAPEADARKKPILPEFEGLESVLENASQWEERFAQIKRWLGKVSTAEKSEESAPTVSWKEELQSRIQAVGYAHVKADFLTEGSPTLWIQSLEARGIVTPYLDNMRIDIVGNDLSTHPGLLESVPKIAIVSDNGRFDANLSFAGEAGQGENLLGLNLKQYSVDTFAKGLKTSGEPILQGGLMDVSIGGRFGTLQNDLKLQASFDGTTAHIDGQALSLDGVTVPIELAGPIDALQFKLDKDFLAKILLGKGKKRLFDELGIDSEEAGEGAEGLLKGLIKKKLQGEEDG